MSTLYRARCGQCGAIYGYQGRPLEFVRLQCCDACRRRLTVIGHEETPLIFCHDCKQTFPYPAEGSGEMRCPGCRGQRLGRAGNQSEGAAVTKAPGIESCAITERTIGIARGLVLSALGE